MIEQAWKTIKMSAIRGGYAKRIREGLKICLLEVIDVYGETAVWVYDREANTLRLTKEGWDEDEIA